MPVQFLGRGVKISMLVEMLLQDPVHAVGQAWEYTGRSLYAFYLV